MSNIDKLLFIKRTFGSYEKGRDGQNVAVKCPNCKEANKKKLAIRLDDDRINCWVCGLRGRLIGVLKRFRSRAVLKEYIEKFAGRNINLFLDDSEDEIPPIKLPERFRLLAPRLHDDDPTIRWAFGYLRGRGLTERDLWYFKFGVSVDPDMHRRVIMPSFDAEGELNYYTGRTTDPKMWRKYMNCDAEKKSIVFNELNIDWSKELMLVEGPFDLVKCDCNATCLLGSSLGEDSKLFGRIYQNKTPVLLALDRDMQNKSWQRIARMLSDYDVRVRLLDLGTFADVGEMTKEQLNEAKDAAHEWDRTDALLLKIRTMQTSSILRR